MLWKLRSFRSLELNVNKRLFTMSWKPRLGSLVKSFTEIWWYFWLSERGHFPPSKPSVGLSTAKVLHFFHSCKILHKKIAIHVRKHKWQFRQNINKTHFFQIGGLREFSRSSQGRRSVKLSILWRNEKRRNLKKTHFCIKIALKSKLSRDFVANVHFLLYLCRQNAHTTLHHIICLLCAVYGQGW